MQEKVDGSQISFGSFDGELKIRSKGKELVLDAPEKMFRKAVAAIRDRHEAGLLVDGFTYRGEYLETPAHNVNRHDRTPQDHIIIFDVCSGYETYLGPAFAQLAAFDIGFEYVPVFYTGRVNDLESLLSLLDRESVLGGCKIEGIVVKNYHRFGSDGKALLGKYVSDKFKEAHGKVWKNTNPKSGDIILDLQMRYKTEARWQKALQHLRELGQLTDTPADIGKLIVEIQRDTDWECSEEIKELLYKWAWPKIARHITGGAPQWYKDLLAAKQFEGPPCD